MNEIEKKDKCEGADRVTLPHSAEKLTSSVPVAVRHYVMRRKDRDRWIDQNTEETQRMDLQVAPSEKRKKLQKDLQHKIRRLQFLILLLAGIVVLAMILQATSSLFVIRNITVTGTDRYTASELAAVGGFGEGTRMRSLSATDAANRILQTYPEFASCRVETDLNGNVAIRVEPYQPVLYFPMNGRYYALTKDLYVTESADTADRFVKSGLLYAELPGISVAIEGKKLELSAGNGNYITTFLEAADNSGALTALSGLSFENRYSIIAYTPDGGSTRYGSVEDIGRKLQIAERLFEMHASDGAVLNIDVSEPEAALIDIPR